MKFLETVILMMTTACCSLLPTISYAHVIEPSTTTFTDGFLHPLLGLNHLLVITIVGVMSAQLPTRKLWFAPICFIYLIVIHGHIHYRDLFTHLGSLSYDLGFCISTSLVYGLSVLLGLTLVKQRHIVHWQCLNLKTYV